MKFPDNEIEITAKSFEEAVEQAAQQLNVVPSQLQVDLIEENKKLFGRGHVKIKATIIMSSQAQPEKRDKPKGRGKKVVQEEIAEVVEVKEPITVVKNVKKEQRPAKKQTGKEKLHVEIDLEKEKETPSENEVIANEDDAAEYLLALREILKLANLRVKAQLKYINGRYVYISLEGEDIGLLLTRRAETLNSLQYLLNIILFRKIGKSIRVSLDAGEYRQKREDSLCQLAQQIAKEVILRGEEAVLDPLPAFERRIIHNYLQGTKGIRTYSEGDEPNRYVVIAPGE